MATFVSFLFALCLTQAVLSKVLDDEVLFESWIKVHSRHYADEEEKQARFEIFKDNLEKASQMNQDSEHATFGITQFMDLNTEEFLRLYSGLRTQEHHIGRSEPCKILTDRDIPNVSAPGSFDWRDYNAVTPSKRQGFCGSCYAFSVIGNIEGQYAIKYKKLIEFSKQQIVDCDQSNGGCDGGNLDTALRNENVEKRNALKECMITPRWLIDNGGLQTEADYPYTSVGGYETMCKFNQKKVKVNIVDCYAYNITSAEKLKQLLFLNGPLSVGLVPNSLQHYTDGVLLDKDCIKNKPIDHAVLLVGYGTDEKTGVPYWILKDSQGPSTGENGFFRLQRGEGINTCNMFGDDMVTSVIA